MQNGDHVQWPGWNVVRLIGRGSFGSVYEIERDLFGKKETAALKHIGIPQNDSDIDEMYSDGYDQESITATFQRHLESIVAEYSLMRKLNGAANVVNCDDVRYVQREDGIGWDIYIKMELLTPLTKSLPEKVPVETVEKLAKDMCHALALCRRFDIVHRDIKPQNIFISPLGDYKLGDFGIAKTVEKTTGGTKTGTYKYMAPEVYHNQPYGHQADIYSLGLVLYWMLNEKRMPFVPLPPVKLNAEMDEQARIRRLTGDPVPPPVNGSEELKRIVLKACAYDPKDRYRTADEMLEDLMRLSSHQIPDSVQETEQAPDYPAMETQSASTEETTIGAFGAPHLQRSNKAGSRPDTSASVVSEGEDEESTIGAIHSRQYKAVSVTGSNTEEAGHKQIYSVGQQQITKASNHSASQQRKSDVQAGTAKKPRKWLIAAILSAVSILAVLGICYFCVHSWIPATCTEPETCKICGKIRGAALGHSWAEATCTTPKTCRVCGEVSGVPQGHSWAEATCTTPKTCRVCGEVSGVPLGHSWMAATKSAPATCSVCGETTGTPILPVLSVINTWWDGDDSFSPSYDCVDNVATLSFSAWDDFAQSEITVTDASSSEISTDSFAYSWVSGKVSVSPKESLALGVYTLIFSCQDGRVGYSLCYGYTDEIYLASTSTGWHNFYFQNVLNGNYLVQTDSGLTTSQQYSDKTMFASSNKICGVDKSSGSIIYPAKNRMVDFTTSTYVCLDEREYFVFSYQGWYLASDESGSVYLATTLGDDCYWLFAP